jgi:putative ABC transport system permease protein
MDALIQKIKADITSRPLISTLIIITIATAATLLTMALGTLMNINAPYERSFNELNGAHLWLYFDRDKVRSRDIEQIEALPGVTASTGLQYSVQSRVLIGDVRVLSSLRAIPLEPPAVNRLLVQHGAYLEPRQPQLLANEDFNYFYQLDVGDAIVVTAADGKELSLPVAGLVYNPMWDTYRNVQPPYLYLSEATLRDLFPDEATWDWSIGLRLADPDGVDDMIELIEATLRPETVDKYTDWRDVRTSAIFETQLNFIFLAAFSLFAILATILVIASSISAIVLSQFKQIGMLKAIGFTQAQILALYLGQYLVLSFIGCLIGSIIGSLLAPLALDNIAASLNTTRQSPFDLRLLAMVFSLISIIIILASLGAAYRGARANTIKAIAIGAEAPRHKPFWGVNLASRLGLPLILTLSLDDLFARPWRSFLTGLNLTLGVIGIVFSLALNSTLTTYKADPTLLGIVYDAVLTRDETSHGRTRYLLKTAPGLDAFYGESLVDAQTLDGRSFQVRAVEGSLAAFPIEMLEGHFFEPNSYEAIAGKGLLDWLGLKVGDELTLILAEEMSRPVTWRIVGQYPEPSNAGQMLMISLPTAGRYVKHLKPSSYYLKLSPGADIAELKQYLEPNQRYADLTLTLVTEAIPWSIVYLQLAIFALALILIGIALINVFNSSLLAVQEKLRMVGILKTVGMTPSQVVTMINAGAGFLGLMAALLGIPLGLLFTKLMLNLLATNFGVGGQVNITLNGFYALLIVPLMVLISMAGSFVPGRRAARLTIVNVLRRE